MGRKGVSKRKPKAKPLAKDKTSGGVSSIGRALESQLVKPPEDDKTIIPAPGGSAKRSSGSKNNSKKR